MAKEAPAAATSVRVIPLGAAPFAVHLVRAAQSASGAKGRPFVRLSGETEEARVYLAELQTETGVVLERLTLKVPGPNAPAGVFPEIDVELTNPSLEAQWGATRAEMRRLSASGRYFPELLLPAEDDRGAVPTLLPPLLFCPVPGRLFPIPCPVCLEPLVTCREDHLLAESGLPRFSSSALRYLYCRRCAEPGSRLSFFAPLLPGGGAQGPAGGLEDLRQKLAETIEAGTPVPAGTMLPCVSCTEAGACLGLDGRTGHAREGAPGKKPTVASGKGRWEVFTAQDTPFMVSRFYHLTLTEYGELVGGRPLPESLGMADLAGSPLLLTAAESGVDALEVLALKVGVFLQLLRAVHEYHRLLGTPHLNLHPRQVLVELGRDNGTLPWPWTARVRLLGTSTSRRRVVEGGVEVVLPPRNLTAPFFSARVRDFSLLSARTGELVIERVLQGERGGHRCRLQVRLMDPLGVFPVPGPDDLVLLNWFYEILGTGFHSLIGRPLAGQASAHGQLSLQSEPLSLSDEVLQRLQSVAGLQIPQARYKVYPGFGPEDDLYSLGMILVQLLAVNDGADLGVVAAGVNQALARAKADGGGTAMVAGMLVAEQASLFAKRALFHRQVDRMAERPNSLPDGLWLEALRLGVSMIVAGHTTGPGPASGGSSSAERAPGLGEAISCAETLLRRLHGILFQRQGLNLEIQSVIGALLAEESRVEGPGPGPVSSTVLATGPIRRP